MAKDNSYDAKLKKFLIPVLRRKSLWWTGRQEAKSAARVERGFYKCAACKNEKYYGPKEIELDHIQPVVNVRKSWTNWDDYLKSLFCDASNFQVLCKPHHQVKTQIEDAQRNINKKKKKSKK